MSKEDIIYLKHSEINKEKWDNCISNSTNGYVYAYSWYLDIVSPGWEALIENDYESVFPLPCKKKYGVSYLIQPNHIQQLGVFSKINSETKKFTECIPSKYNYAELWFNYKSVLRGIDTKLLTERQTFFLDLKPSYKKIYESYSSNLERNLKKAENARLLLKKETACYAEVIRLFRNNKGKELSINSGNYYKTFDVLAKELIARNFVDCRVIFNDRGKVSAGAIFVKALNKIIFLFSGTDEYAKNNGSMSFIINEIIKENSTTDYILDFEGSNILSLARFYQGFGAHKVIYWRYKSNNLPGYLKWIKR